MIASIEGHGTMYEPPTRQSGGLSAMRPACTMGSCLWFNQGCTIGCPFCTGGGSVYPSEPDCDAHAEPTLKFDDKDLRTYALVRDLGDWTKYKPWRYPGSAPVRDPCGIAGGWFTKGTPGNGGEAPLGYTNGILGTNLTALPRLLEQTIWVAGSVQEVAWGLTANHGGGYQYRLCPAEEAQTEECFQKMPLNFVTSKSWIQRGHGMDVDDRVEIEARNVDGDKVVPIGSTWRRNPIPACDTPISGGAIRAPCVAPIFKPPFKGKEGESWGFGGGTCESEGITKPCTDKQFGKHSFDFGIVDLVEVPNVPEGNYTLSFRWDAEQTPQVWNQCADVTITKTGKPSKPFTDTNGCTHCCALGGLCQNCTGCLNDKTGDCAYCWNPLQGYAPGAPKFMCLGADDTDGGAPEWYPGMDSSKALGLGCGKCWKGDGCKSYTRESAEEVLVA